MEARSFANWGMGKKARAEGEGEMTRPGADSSMVAAVVFLVLAALAGALLVLNLTVRKKDVIQVEKDNED
jgi:hypothetical protein